MCPDCHTYRATLAALRPLVPGQFATVASQPHVTPCDTGWDGYSVSFDGGARHHRGAKVAGAGAWVWRLQPGPVVFPVAKVVVALPAVSTAPQAEAHGARGALRFLLDHVAGPRRALVTGDNLGVVRFCASTGRLKSVGVEGIVEGTLLDTALAGWDVTWRAVRRRFNKDADSAATQGVHRAMRLADDGVPGPEVTIVWAAGASAAPPADLWLHGDASPAT